MRRFHLLNIGLHSQKRLQPGFVFLQQVRSDCHLVVNDFHNTVTNLWPMLVSTLEMPGESLGANQGKSV